jgi:hypothetical protein
MTKAQKHTIYISSILTHMIFVKYGLNIKDQILGVHTNRHASPGPLRAPSLGSECPLKTKMVFHKVVNYVEKEALNSNSGGQKVKKKR